MKRTVLLLAASPMVLAVACDVSDDERRLDFDGEVEEQDEGDHADQLAHPATGELPGVGVTNVEYPVATLTLANGNLLQFYATPADGWSGVIESRDDPDAAWLVRTLGQGVSAAEVYRVAAPEGSEMPHALKEVAELNGFVAETPHAAGTANQLLAKPDVQASINYDWCHVDNSDDFSDEFCDEPSGNYDEAQCLIDRVDVGPEGVTSPGARYVHAGWCQVTAHSQMYLGYTPGCSGGTTQVLWSASLDEDNEAYFSGALLSSYRRYYVSRVPVASGEADMGIEWGNECAS